MPSRQQFKTKEDYNNYFKEYRKRFPEKWRLYRKKWREKNGHDYLIYKKKYPQKYRAHKLLSYAIKVGFIKRKKCINCGEPKTQGHHDDYTKPLQVIWLCQECHSLRHAE